MGGGWGQVGGRRGSQQRACNGSGRSIPKPARVAGLHLQPRGLQTMLRTHLCLHHHGARLAVNLGIEARVAAGEDEGVLGTWGAGRQQDGNPQRKGPALHSEGPALHSARAPAHRTA